MSDAVRSVIDQRFAEMQPTIEEAAAQAASHLDTFEYAAIDLSPGDGTLYRLMLIPEAVFIPVSKGRSFPPGHRHIYVASNFAPAYPWSGTRLSEDYAAEKFGNDHPWTGRVIAEFLNAVAERLPEGWWNR